MESEERPGHLLIVDDNRLNRMKLGKGLEQQGHTFEEARDGLEALEKLRAGSFDLVVLDILMPEMDGYEVLEHMKADEALRSLPVVVISALDEMDSIVHCIGMGAEDYLPKPFDPVLLKARVDACLEKKRLRDREVELFRQLQANYRQLKELEKLRDDLTHMIVHDLRTPLTSVLTGLLTMETLGELNPDQAEFLSMGVQGSRTLLGMINDLLDISKLEEGSLQLEREQLSAGPLFEEATKQVGPLAKDRELNLVCGDASAVPAFSGDAQKLTRTLVNLLGNAVKFTPVGGTVSLSATVDPGCSEIVFSVADTGEGIPEDAYETIFEKFGQVATRKAGRKMSTGLGLTFCKLVAEAHGGRIWVGSAPDEGSTFSFAIPLDTASAS